MIRMIFLFFSLILLVSCKTIISNQFSQTKTTQQVNLGSVGLDKDFLLQQEFNNAAIPTYNKPIKLRVSIKSFNKQTYKILTKAKVSQPANFSVIYIDSIPKKPQYLQLQIADKVSVLEDLNSKANYSLKDYLILNKRTNIITDISIALNQNDLENIANADAVFLVEESYKKYVLQYYKTSTEVEKISFSEGIIFGYKTANCCWQENSKHQLSIVDLVSDFNNCPNKTYRSANRAKKKINYFKL
ncbi:hypothetical protein [Changchengzhania lutea]|uniref:hypothetical protein n=1 Tax=Changchengzhania lutea TaxID=2049305 RepID=UPI00115F5AB2|nr:hypothetical protein [Changchengzhania lutea]